MSDRPVIRVGLIGSGLSQTLTPAMHEAEGAAQGLDYRYSVFDLDRLEGAAALPRLLDQAQGDGFAGLNITHPCKQQVIGLLDDLDPDVERIGACNTVVFDGARRVGRNTDWFGYAEAFRRDFAEVPTGRVIQLGAGGAGSAVAYALLTLGVGDLAIFDVDTPKAEGLRDRYAAAFGHDRIRVVEDAEAELTLCDGLVQTTPIGSLGHTGLPADPARLPEHAWVSDVIYFPLETELVRAAKARGLRARGGGGMAVFQAVRAFESFTGLTADPDRFAACFQRLVNERVGR